MDGAPGYPVGLPAALAGASRPAAGHHFRARRPGERLVRRRTGGYPHGAAAIAAAAASALREPGSESHGHGRLAGAAPRPGPAAVLADGRAGRRHLCGQLRWLRRPNLDRGTESPRHLRVRTRPVLDLAPTPTGADTSAACRFISLQAIESINRRPPSTATRLTLRELPQNPYRSAA